MIISGTSAATGSTPTMRDAHAGRQLGRLTGRPAERNPVSRADDVGIHAAPTRSGRLRDDRRSVYLMTQRIARHPYRVPCRPGDTKYQHNGRRGSSTTSLQAL